MCQFLRHVTENIAKLDENMKIRQIFVKVGYNFDKFAKKMQKT